MTGSLFPRADGETRAGEQAAGPASCWCLEYHFLDLDDREVCECPCHGPVLVLDADSRRVMMAVALMSLVTHWMVRLAKEEREGLGK